MIIVKNKRCKVEKLLSEYPGAEIIDVTSKASEPWLRLSPFYPHGGIPIPFTDRMTSMSVEGVWQGLKVFEKADVDRTSFANSTMKGLKRTVRRNGVPRGHRKGVYGTRLLDYIEARKLIYLPTYVWMLEHKCADLIERLKQLSATRTVILLDYDTNGDVDDGTTPLSHASLVAAYVEGRIG